MDYLTGFLIFAVVVALVLGGLWYKGMYPFGNALTIGPSGGSSVGANIMAGGMTLCPKGYTLCPDGVNCGMNRPFGFPPRCP